MAETYLISAARIKQVTEVDSNVDDKIIKRAIVTAQDIWIEQILGTGLMDKIKELITAGSIEDNENSAYKTLLDNHIENALIYYTLEELLDLITYKINNKGVLKREAEEAQPISNPEKADMKRRYHSKAENYADRLMRFLVVHQEDYEEYLNPGDTIDKIKPKKSGFNSGFYFG